MPTTQSTTFLDRFRHWYDHERDCNAKVIAMLESVPDERRSSEPFIRALQKGVHLQATRHMWLHRLGVCDDRPDDWFPSATLDQLPAITDKAERLWLDYLASLTEADLLADVSWRGKDDTRYRYPLIDLLTQISGHAWYHRGQIATLVKDAGGQPTNTDYIFWDRPTPVPDGE